MKKVLSWISATIGYVTLFIFASGLKEGIIDNDSDLIIGIIILTLPIGFLFRWLSLTEKTKIERLFKIIDDIFIILIIHGVTSIFGHLMLPQPYISNITTRLVVGILFVVLGALGLFLINKIPHTKKDKNIENDNVETIQNDNVETIQNEKTTLKNILITISSFISTFLLFFGLGGVLSPLLQRGNKNSLTFFVGIIFMFAGSFFRKLSLRSIDEEDATIVMFMDISLIGILQTISLIVELSLNIPYERSPMPKIIILLASTFAYIKLRKIYGESEYKDRPYRTPIILLIIMSIVYIPLGLTIGRDSINAEYVAIYASLFIVVITAIVYEMIKTAKHIPTIPKPIKFVLNKTLLIILSILFLLGLAMAREVGKDIVRQFSRDGMTREGRMMNRTVNKTTEDNTYKKETYISGDIVTNIKKELGGTMAGEKNLEEEYRIFEELTNVENIEHTIGMVQLKLMIEGYYTDDADGILGEKTKEALITFQEENFSFSTGTLNLGTLKALGIIK